MDRPLLLMRCGKQKRLSRFGSELDPSRASPTWIFEHCVSPSHLKAINVAGALGAIEGWAGENTANHVMPP